MSGFLNRTGGLAIAILAVLPAVAAAAQTPSAAPYSLEGCLSRRDAIAQVRTGAVLPLRQIRRTAEDAAHGEMINAALCNRDGKSIYVVTVLGISGKVAYVTLDARNGQLLSVR